jgi:hypothetical protein
VLCDDFWQSDQLNIGGSFDSWHFKGVFERSFHLLSIELLSLLLFSAQCANAAAVVVF